MAVFATIAVPAKIRDVFDAWCVIDGSRTTRWVPWQAGRIKETVHRQFAKVAASGPRTFHLLRGHIGSANRWLERVRRLPPARVSRVLELFATKRGRRLSSGVELSLLTNQCPIAPQAAALGELLRLTVEILALEHGLPLGAVELGSRAAMEAWLAAQEQARLTWLAELERREAARLAEQARLEHEAVKLAFKMELVQPSGPPLPEHYLDPAPPPPPPPPPPEIVPELHGVAEWAEYIERRVRCQQDRQHQCFFCVWGIELLHTSRPLPVASKQHHLL